LIYKVLNLNLELSKLRTSKSSLVVYLKVTFYIHIHIFTYMKSTLSFYKEREKIFFTVIVQLANSVIVTYKLLFGQNGQVTYTLSLFE